MNVASYLLSHTAASSSLVLRPDTAIPCGGVFSLNGLRLLYPPLPDRFTRI
jgi:hypothetical protein